MKTLFISLFALIAIHSASAQGHFSNGDNVASIGIGLGSSLGVGSGSSSTPGISLQYEHGNWDVGGPGVISLGGYLGLKSFKYSSGPYEQKWSYTIIGLRSAYHFNGIQSSDFDVYGGAMLSYNILSYSDNYPYNYYHSGTWGSYISLTLYLGARYYFQNNFAVQAELGYGISYLNLGVAYKF